MLLQTTQQEITQMQPIDLSMILKNPQQLRELADLLECWDNDAKEAEAPTPVPITEESALEPPTTTDAQAPVAADVDATGRPWMPEIDSANRTTTAAGLWRAKKGVDKQTRQVVIEDWERNRGATEPVATTDPATPTEPATEPATPNEPAESLFDLFGAQPVPAQAEQARTVPAQLDRIEQASPMDWPTFVGAITKVEGGYDHAKGREFLTSHGLETMPDLVNHPELLRPFLAHVGIEA